MKIIPDTTPLPPVRITLSGCPRAQPRPRFVPGQKPVSTLAPRIKRWRLGLAQAVEDAVHALGEEEVADLQRFAFVLAVEFRFPVAPKNRHWAGLPHHHKPDIDNLMKPVMDELQKGLIPDDGKIARVATSKVWVSRGASGEAGAGMTLVLYPVDAPREGRTPGFSPKKNPGADEGPGLGCFEDGEVEPGDDD